MPPATLSAGARAIWPDILRDLEKARTVDQVGTGLIEAYCEALARHRALCATLEGADVVSPEGKLHPALRTIEATAASTNPPRGNKSRSGL